MNRYRENMRENLEVKAMVDLNLAQNEGFEEIAQPRDHSRGAPDVARESTPAYQEVPQSLVLPTGDPGLQSSAMRDDLKHKLQEMKQLIDRQR